jgi:hypothetical protein
MKKLTLIIGVLFSAGVILFFVSQYFLAEKRPHAMTNLLSKDDINTINSYRGKYQSSPGPSDAEVLDVAKIILAAELSKDDIKQLLGKPSSIGTLDKAIAGINADSLEYWAYDVGDSRRIEIRFDNSGNLISIYGVGVGFDTLTLQDRSQIDE